MLRVDPYVAEVLDTLVAWTLEGLDLSKAIAQPETAYKVRHLKMGIKMTGTLCSCDSFIASIMLVSASNYSSFNLDVLTCQKKLEMVLITGSFCDLLH